MKLQLSDRLIALCIASIPLLYSFGLNLDILKPIVWIMLFTIAIYLLISKSINFVIDDLITAIFIFCIYIKDFLFFSERWSIFSTIQPAVLFLVLRVTSYPNKRFITAFVFVFPILYFLLLVRFAAKYGDDLMFSFSPNVTLFAICITSYTLLWWFSYGYLRRSKLSLIVILIMITLMLLIILSKARTAATGLLILLICYIRIKCISKRIHVLLVIISSCIILATFWWLKPGSTNGRILITKITIELIKDHPLFGVGSGHFAQEYLKCQAEYFSKRNIQSSEAMLADNTAYAFNDFLQLISEQGIVIFLFMVMFIIWQLKSGIRSHGSAQKISFLSPVLFFLFICCFFYYPLHYVPTLIIVIGTLSHLTEKSGKLIKSSALKIGLLILCSGCIIYNLLFIYSTYNYNSALNLQRIGRNTEALQHYNLVIIPDGKALADKADLLLLTGKNAEALYAIEESRTMYRSYRQLIIAGKIESRLKMFKKAETDFKDAVYTVPKRIESRVQLYDFYKERHENDRAQYWAKMIKEMPININRERANQIQRVF